MNVFYVSPEQVFPDWFELRGQEARHAAKVLRHKVGDTIFATDGKGNRFSGTITTIGRDMVSAKINGIETTHKPERELVLALGIVRKKDRLELAIEKAVELGATEITLFHSDHTEKVYPKSDRLQATAISAMKQSLRSWLPEIRILDSLEEVLADYPNHIKLMAHEKTAPGASGKLGKTDGNLLLLVGPEGGFSDREVHLAEGEGGELVSLGKYRLRAETAAIAFLSQFIMP